MVVISFDGGLGFLETNIIKPGKGGATDISYGVIWYQEVFFPSHEDVICIGQLAVVKVVRIEGLYVLVKLREFALKYFDVQALFFTKKKMVLVNFL